jgi:hypothetical protein
VTDGRSDAAAGADPRPRPAYGEYATPEEQRARIQQPDLTYALDTGQDPDTVIDRTPAASAPAWVPLTPSVDRVTATRAGRRRVDLIVAAVLLGYGLVNVVVTILQLRDFSVFADQFFRLAGISGSFTNIAAGQLWGTIGAVVLGAGWLITAGVAFLVGRRGHLVWWIPLVGAAIFLTLYVSCLMVALYGDPAVMEFFTSAG